VLGDNAYICTNRLLTPFTVIEKGNCPWKDSFCNRLSQLRIRVEMAFGVITKVWGCLRHDYTGALENAKRLLTAIFVLHNYRIGWALGSEEGDDEVGTMPSRGLRPHTHAVGAEFRHPLSEASTMEGGNAGDEEATTSYDPREPSFLRDEIVQELHRRGLRRYNDNLF